MSYKKYHLTALLLVSILLFVCINKALADAGMINKNIKSQTKISKNAKPEQKNVLEFPYFKIISSKDLSLPGAPQKVAVNSSGTFALIPAYNLNILYYISISKNNVGLKCTIPTGSGPTNVVITKNSNRAYVSNEKSDSISIISLKNSDLGIITNITVGKRPYAIALSPDEKYLYVTNRADNTVSVIELSEDNPRVINVLKVGTWPSSIKICKKTKMALVVNTGSNDVTKIDLTSPMGAVFGSDIAVNLSPIDVAISNNGDMAIVTNSLSNNASVFNPLQEPSEIIGTIDNLSRPWGISSDSNTNLVVLTNSNNSLLNFYNFGYSSEGDLVELRHDNPEIAKDAEFVVINRPKGIMIVTNPSSEQATVIRFKLSKIEMPMPVEQPVTPAGSYEITPPFPQTQQNTPSQSGMQGNNTQCPLPNSQNLPGSQGFSGQPSSNYNVTDPGQIPDFLKGLFQGINNVPTTPAAK